MAAGDLITGAWQVELGGLLMGDGTEFVVREFDPWAAPATRPGEAPRAQTHGSYPGRDWLGDRLVSLSLAVDAVSDVLEQAARRELAGVWQPPSDDVVPLVWMEDDGVRYALFGKPRLADTRLQPRLYTECRFVATDPRIYSLPQVSISATLPTSAGGLVFPAVAPFVFGTSGAGGALAATNAGQFATPYVLTFTGPLVSPTVEHTAQGKTLAFSGTLAAGETLVVDSAARTVLLNGTASRYSWLTAASQWFTLEPGANALRFGGASGAGSCGISFMSAWL